MSFGSFDPTKQGYKNNRAKKFYLKDGSNVFRILPPVKSLAEKNKIAQYWSVIWLTDTNGKKRPVSSILKKQNKVILQHDPLITKIEEMKAQLDAAMAAGENPAVIETLKLAAKRLMHKKFYALNAIDASGTVGVLELPYTSYQNLESRIKELNTNGIDAIGIGADKGVFFDFKKIKDERGRTVYPVDPHIKVSKDASGQFTMNYVRMSISPEEANQLVSQVEDLTTLYRELTLDQHTALATLDQRAFDAVFSRPVEVEENPDLDEQDVQGSVSTSSYTPNTVLGSTQGSVSSLNLGTNGTIQQPLSSMQPLHSMPLNQNSGFAGTTNVVNNAQVKNFLFPDAAKKG